MNDVKRGPNLSEAMHRSHLQAVEKARAQKAADDTRVARLAEVAGVSVAAIRRAEVEKRAADQAEAGRQELDVARATVAARSPDAQSETPQPIPEATPENVVAELRRRERVGEPVGVDALADHFAVGATTIRRRLGRNKTWK